MREEEEVNGFANEMELPFKADKGNYVQKLASGRTLLGGVEERSELGQVNASTSKVKSQSW